MTRSTADLIANQIHVLRTRWEHYAGEGSFESFIEFTVAVNSLAEQFNRMRLPGLVRLCEGLEATALSLLGTQDSHPIEAQEAAALQRQLDTLLGAIQSLSTSVNRQRAVERPLRDQPIEWIKPRSVWLVAHPGMHETVDALAQQLIFFGFQALQLPWDSPLPAVNAPLAILFAPNPDFRGYGRELGFISTLRARCPTSQLVYIGAHPAIETLVGLMRAGIDVSIPRDEGSTTVINCVLDLVQNYDQEKYRVLVVEDSRVASALIQRTLAGHGIDSQAIGDPGTLLATLAAYRPDLILMDMHMPRFNGVEATRVLRQMPAYKALPIVYLSGESDIGMQVEALRLGGDQFLVKPFNPVLLAAVVKTKIERFRETLRSTQIDGLTGLLNHTAAKSRLRAMSAATGPGAELSVVMIDIDHFKSVNDAYGHPVGDQVIRGLAWLLKGRLRTSDLIGRYGGEEFIVALAGVGQAQAREVIDRIREDFSVLPHTHSSGALFSTFSAGIASSRHHENLLTLTEAADRALLEAKHLGRNRVEIENVPPIAP